MGSLWGLPRPIGHMTNSRDGTRKGSGMSAVTHVHIYDRFMLALLAITGAL